MSSDNNTGGLIQLVNYGNQDIMLTGTPEITFFRIIFRRYTNFGVALREIPFDNEVTFGNNLTATIPKSNGDLLTKLTLKIKLPAIDLTNLNNEIMTQLKINKNTLEEYLVYYNNLLKFINKLQNVVDNFFSKNDEMTSTTYIQDLKDYILKYINADEFVEFFIIVNFFFNNKIITPSNYVNVKLYENSSLFKLKNNDLFYIYETSNNVNYSFSLFKNMIYVNMGILDLLNTTCYQLFRDTLVGNNIITGAWVKSVAINMVKSIELNIGSNIIQKFSSDYIHNYGQTRYENTALYNTIIGNSENVLKNELIKGEQYLYLPIPFYFCDNYGLSLPLVGIHYSTISIKMKLAPMSELIYFDVSNKNNSSVVKQIKEEIRELVYSSTIQIFDTQLQLSFLAEYIYIDGPERKKFASSSHEYLMSDVQEVVFDDVNTFNNSFDLQFFHCTSQCYWFLKQYKYTNNIVNENDPLKYDVSINANNYTDEQLLYIAYINILYNAFVPFDLNIFIKGRSIATEYIDLPVTTNLNIQTSVSPALESKLLLNGLPHSNYDYRYYNYLQPYAYYNNFTNLGLNVYSFSLHPTEYQSSGSVNLSILPKFSIAMVIYNDISPVNETFNLSKHNLNDYQLVFQCVSYNVVRIIGGYCAKAFSTY